MVARFALLLEVLAAVLLGAAIAAVVAGPLRFDVAATSLSVRTLSRPLVAAAVLFALRLLIERAPGQMARTTGAVARVVAGAVLSAGVIGWAAFLSMTCGGADSYGYVSAADRLLDGALVQHEPLARVMPFADGINAATPLGYTPSRQVADASVPVYPLGLPALMALARVAAGVDGPFFVAPVMGLVLIGAVYTLAASITGDRMLALIAAALAAVHPVVFTYSIQPMSDVPAAACFLVAVAALARRSPWPVLAGVAAAVCLAIRPALAPALAALVVVPSLVRRRADTRAALMYGVPLAAGVAVQLSTQWYLYGHPLANGYAAMGTLFSVERLGANARSHGYWAWRAIGPVFLGAMAIGLAVSAPIVRRLAAVIVTTVAMPYLVYRTFDHWETLRFLLPALVLLAIPAAAGLLAVSRRVAGEAGGPLLAVVLAGAIAATWASWLRANDVFGMPALETRYRTAGDLVGQTTPPHAVILAALHSGSIRYYAHRASISWDRVPSGAMPATVAALKQAGHPVYLLVDGDEERRQFESLHGATADWLPGGQRRNIQLLEAR